MLKWRRRRASKITELEARVWLLLDLVNHLQREARGTRTLLAGASALLGTVIPDEDDEREQAFKESLRAMRDLAPHMAAM